MRPHRRQPTRLPLAWDSPGKNTGVGCHCLLWGRHNWLPLLIQVFYHFLPELGFQQCSPNQCPFSRMILLPLAMEPWLLAPEEGVWEIIHTPELTPLCCRCAWECAKSFQLCLTLFNPLDCSHSGFSVHGILQARILKWVAISSSPRLQGIFPTQGSNSCLLPIVPWQADSLPLGLLWSPSPPQDDPHDWPIRRGRSTPVQRPGPRGLLCPTRGPQLLLPIKTCPKLVASQPPGPASASKPRPWACCSTFQVWFTFSSKVLLERNHSP